MRVFSQFLILITIFFGSCRSAWTQSNCDEVFTKISTSCIQNNIEESSSLNPNKFSSNPILVSPDINNNVYFYQTASGEFGKMKVISAVANPNIAKPRECTMFLDAVTFGQKNKSFNPNSSLSIAADQNFFLTDINYLDREGLSALEMTRLPTDKDGNILEIEGSDGKRILNEAAIEEKYSKMIVAGESEEKAKELKQELTEKLSNADMRCFILPTKGVKIGLYKKISGKSKKEDNFLLFFAPLVLVFIAIFLIVRVFMEEQDKFKTQEALEEAENVNKQKTQPLLIKATKPFYKRYFVPMVQGFKNKQKIKTNYRQKLANGGLSKEITPEEFLALKIFMILGGPFVFLTIRWILSETWPLAITPLMGIVGYFYPDIWLSGRIKQRNDETLKAMPFIVDMLALSVEAGLDFMAAIQRVIEKAPRSPLVEEFETLIKETKIGSSRAEGLRQLGWRVNVIEINSFCATLIAADSVGASIAPILKQLSAELRVKRSSRAEQLGATAATKILIPMIFFILPAVLVAVFLPFVFNMMGGT